MRFALESLDLFTTAGKFLFQLGQLGIKIRLGDSGNGYRGYKPDSSVTLGFTSSGPSAVEVIAQRLGALELDLLECMC